MDGSKQTCESVDKFYQDLTVSRLRLWMGQSLYLYFLTVADVAEGPITAAFPQYDPNFGHVSTLKSLSLRDTFNDRC